ncbi:immunity protein YezG family protein [Microvirga sp. Mcv34]|uniref:immunity protein YezG family protein n=1 Tax=Microvirga sp. Mcv34 TaxID=2926016 RepID=UPI0021C5A930|nr:immunity protein YezG family protein [Microvirga sp. Mcv34]
MNTNRLEELYLTIGNAIADTLGTNWSKAWIIAKLEDDHGEFDFKYQASAEDPARSFAKEVAPKMHLIYNAFNEIRALTCEASRGHWTSALFELSNGGGFKLNFSYDD